MTAPWWVQLLCLVGAVAFFWGLSRLDPDPRPASQPEATGAKDGAA